MKLSSCAFNHSWRVFPCLISTVEMLHVYGLSSSITLRKQTQRNSRYVTSSEWLWLKRYTRLSIREDKACFTILTDLLNKATEVTTRQALSRFLTVRLLLYASVVLHTVSHICHIMYLIFPRFGSWPYYLLQVNDCHTDIPCYYRFII
jgi:hypothetical protein